MGKLVDLEQRRRQLLLEQALERLTRGLDQPAPAPEELGWVPVERDEQQRVVRWTLLRQKAFIGYVPGAPEHTFLDVSHELHIFEHLSIEDLALGIETGTLPDADLRLDWRGERIE